ncbi:MAG: hypothetical protein Q8Q52_08070 [Acidimicrobiia bacterium]|nr:hypothetical protein [Acidimicrobiia bacterium]
MRTLASTAALTLVLVASPVWAQSSQQGQSSESTGGPVRLEASAGIANFVDFRRPVDLAVTISADVLFTGTLEIRHASSLVVIPVEVPAGGTKTYRAVVPPPVGGDQARIRLFATGSDQPAVSRSLQLKVPSDESLVAVSGPPELAATINSATVNITGAEVVAALVGTDQLNSGMEPANYLVLSPAIELSPPVAAWLRSGGRLVIDDNEAALLGLDLGAPSFEADTTQFAVGRGRVVVLDELGDLDSTDWSRVIQPSPMRFAPQDTWQSSDTQMMTAATNAGEQRVPRLPWLLAAVVGYAVLIGPANFLVLGRLRRRELAWVTVPVLSILAVAGFWIAGRGQLQNTLVNHATVIVGGEVPSARSAVALAVGAAGSRSVAIPDGWRAYPTSVTSGFGGELPAASVAGFLNDDGSFTFDLAQLGAVGLQGLWTVPPTDLPAIVTTSDGPELQIDVRNDTDFEFWAWGLVANGRAKVAPDPLAAGARGTESVVRGNPGLNEFESIGDAVINARQLWEDPTAWSRLSPLGMAAASDLGQVDSYFFAFTENLTVPVTVNGRTHQAKGTSLVVVPIGDEETPGPSILISHLVAAADASWIESGPGYLTVSGPEMTVGWAVPIDRTDDPELRVTNMFGEIPRRLDAYNWRNGQYEEVKPGQPLDLDRYRSVAGDVLVKAQAREDDDPDQFMEFVMSPYAFLLVWNQ